MDSGFDDGASNFGLDDCALNPSLDDCALNLGLDDAPGNLGLDEGAANLGLNDGALDVGLDDGAANLGLDDPETLSCVPACLLRAWKQTKRQNLRYRFCSPQEIICFQIVLCRTGKAMNNYMEHAFRKNLTQSSIMLMS